MTFKYSDTKNYYEQAEIEVNSEIVNSDNISSTASGANLTLSADGGGYVHVDDALFVSGLATIQNNLVLANGGNGGEGTIYCDTIDSSGYNNTDGSLNLTLKAGNYGDGLSVVFASDGISVRDPDDGNTRVGANYSGTGSPLNLTSLKVVNGIIVEIND